MRAKVDKILSFLLIALMGTMVLNVLWQVASRFVFNSPSVFTDELAGFLLIWVGLLGAAYGTGQKLHLAIDLLPDKLKGKPKRQLDIFILVSVGLFALLALVVGGIRLVYLTLYLQQLSSVLRVPLGGIYLVLPLSGLIVLYYCADDYRILLQTKTIENGTA